MTQTPAQAFESTPSPALVAEVVPKPQSSPEVTKVQSIEITPNGEPKSETASLEPSEVIINSAAQTADLLTSPAEPVTEQQTETIPNAKTIVSEHKEVQNMIKNGEFAGAESVAVEKRQT